jgi:hypothetical protein
VAAALLLGFLWANWHLPLIAAHLYNVTWWQFVIVTMAASVVQHGFYNVGTGIILNNLIDKATLYGDEVQHNVLWMAHGGIAVILCLMTRGRLFYREWPLHV